MKKRFSVLYIVAEKAPETDEVLDNLKQFAKQLAAARDIGFEECEEPTPPQGVPSTPPPPAAPPESATICRGLDAVALSALLNGSHGAVAFDEDDAALAEADFSPTRVVTALAELIRRGIVVDGANGTLEVQSATVDHLVKALAA